MWRLVLAAALAATAGCDDDSFDSPPVFETILRIRDASGAERNRFLRGETITFELSVRNMSATAQTLTFDTSLQSDFVVFDSGLGGLEWQASYGQAYTQAVTTLTWISGETKLSTATWNQVDNAGRTAFLGFYDVQGYVATKAEKARTARGSTGASEIRSFLVRIELL